MLNTSDRNPEITGEPRPGPLGRSKPGSRTAAAAAEFLKAIAGDLAIFWAQLCRAANLYTAHLRKRVRAAMDPGPNAVSRARPRGRLRYIAIGAAITGIGAVFVASGLLLWALLGLPVEHPLAEPDHPTLLLEAADGQPLGRVGRLRVDDAALRDFAPILVQAVLSTEDRRFYRHPGIDLRGIFRAAQANRAAGTVVEGGSTITQQLVKIEYLNDDRTLVRKLREALMAVWLELHLSKDEILQRYLNRVYVGDGAYGMAAAARLYFNKRPAELTLPEAAMLAGLIKAPSEFDPARHPKAAAARAATVLDLMVANHVIDAKTAAAAKASPAIVSPPPALVPAKSWFTDWVAKSATQLAGTKTGIVRVRTTLMPQLQSWAQRLVDKTLAKDGRQRGVGQAALVAMRPDGAVLAMVGGRDYGDSQFNRAVDANRQPGSAFKLFVYLAALRQGFTPEDTIDAGPIDIKGWQPANFDDEHYGRITLADAFAKSVNTAAVRLAMKVGLGNVVAAARDLGITEPLPLVPSLALGSVGVSLLDLTGAFANVKADNLRMRPWGVAAIGALNSPRMLETAPAVTQPQTLGPFQKPLIALLRGVVEHGTGTAAELDGFAAGKTGTSQDYRDAWFIGFNDALVVGIWVGNDDDRPMKRVVGGGLPATMWRAFVIGATPLLDQQGVRVSLAPLADAQSNPDNGLATLGLSGSTNPSCDVTACTAFYHSFRVSDCTYQPYDGGPRQVCEKRENGWAGSPATTTAMSSAQPPAHCNVDRCREFYSSFDPSDCTYKPFGGGPRQLCEK